MTDFEKQLVARLQAMDFVLAALLRAQFAEMDQEEAKNTVTTLLDQFEEGLSVPFDALPYDVAILQQQHSDALHFLERTLRSVAPHGFD